MSDLGSLSEIRAVMHESLRIHWKTSKRILNTDVLLVASSKPSSQMILEKP